jgi:hypothetical protein
MVQNVPSLGCGVVGSIQLKYISSKEVLSLSLMLLGHVVFHILVVPSDLLFV